jgi:hypothetical protein
MHHAHDGFTIVVLNFGDIIVFSKTIGILFSILVYVVFGFIDQKKTTFAITSMN